MLEIVNYNEDEYGFPCLVVLGCFDGIHIGHAELLKKAKLQAKINGLDLGVMMFVDGKGGKQVYTFEERLKFLEQFNVKFVLKINYTDEFKKTAPMDFLLTIEDKLNVKAYMSGKDFRFGAGAKGKSSTLKNYGEDEENGVWYMSVKDVLWNEKKVSTTLVKEFLENGDLKSANELLGRRFSVIGNVIEGADRGGKLLGFPTMNVKYPENKIELKRGVYAVKCTVGEAQYKGIANFGARPTFDEENELVEVHLDGYEGSAYGDVIKIDFAEYLRDIEKFDSPEALAEQLKEDLAKANEIFEAEAQVAVPAAPAAPATAPVAPAAPAEPVAVEQHAEEIAVADIEETSAPVEEVSEEQEFEAELAEEVIEDVIEEVTEEPQEETQEEVAEDSGEENTVD